MENLKSGYTEEGILEVRYFCTSGSSLSWFLVNAYVFLKPDFVFFFLRLFCLLGRQNLVSPERRRRNSLSPLRSPSGGGGGGGGVGLRQIGDVEGVRQVDSNVFISQDVSEAEQAQWRNRTIIPMSKECFRM